MAMFTTATPTTEAMGEHRVLLPGAGRELYEAIHRVKGDHPAPRLTYCEGDIELMSPSYFHEVLTRRLTDLVKLIARGLRLPFRDAGSTRWTRADLDRGIEPDACFYLASESKVRSLREIDLMIHPPPDLVIEVEITAPLLEGLKVYQSLGVPEVWRCDARSVRFFHLNDEGDYVERENSRAFPALRSWEALGWLSRADVIGDMEWSFEVESWVRDELAQRPASGDPSQPLKD